MEGLSFLNKWALFLFPLLVPYLYIRLRGRRAIPFAPAELDEPRFFIPPLVYLPLFLESLIIVILIVMLAGPYKENSRDMISQEGADIILALDISAGMQAADFKPCRLETLKSVASDFVKRSGSHRIGICVFSEQVFTQSPVTTDHSALFELIGGLSFDMIDHSPNDGNAAGDALVSASDALERIKTEGRDQAIILISGGGSNYGIEPTLAARHVRERGIRLYIIGVGGYQPAEVYVNGQPFINGQNQVMKTKPDDGRLRSMAEMAVGNYYRAADEVALSGFFGEISRLESTPLHKESISVKSFYRAGLSAALLIIYMVYLLAEGFFIRRPWR